MIHILLAVIGNACTIYRLTVRIARLGQNVEPPNPPIRSGTIRVLIAVLLLFSLIIVGIVQAGNVDDLITNSSSVRRLGAVNVIVSQYTGERKVQYLARLVNDSSTKVRLKTVEELGKSKCFDALPILKKQLTVEIDGDVKKAIAVAIKELGPPPAEFVKKQEEDAKNEAEGKAILAQHKQQNDRIKADFAGFVLNYSRVVENEYMFNQACISVMNLDNTYRILLNPNHKDFKQEYKMVKTVFPHYMDHMAMLFRVTNVGEIVCYIPELKGAVKLKDIWVAILKIK